MSGGDYVIICNTLGSEYDKIIVMVSKINQNKPGKIWKKNRENLKYVFLMSSKSGTLKQAIYSHEKSCYTLSASILQLKIGMFSLVA